MANEIQIRSQLVIRKGHLNYQSQPVVFQADMEGDPKGPVPGAITVPTVGIDIDFSELDTPSTCRFMNLDDTNFVEYGIYDNDDNIFFPLGEIQPGETYVLRLSRNLGEAYTNTGTGTSAAVHSLHFKADTAACVVVIEAFEK